MSVPALRFAEFEGEWEEKHLGAIAETVTSGSRDWAQFYADEGAKFIRMTNIPRDGINLMLSDMKYVRLPQTGSEGARTSLQGGDILFSITAELGKIGIVPDDLGEAYINQHTALVRPSQQKVVAHLLAQLLGTKASNKRINRLNDSGAKAGLNLSTIRSFKVTLPSLPEQKKIAAFLGVVDDKLAALRARKAGLETYKRGLMQNLFSRSAFPDWEEKRLGEIAVIKAGDFIKASKISTTASDVAYPAYGGNGLRGYVAQHNREGPLSLIGRQGALCGNVHFVSGQFYATEHALVADHTPDTCALWLFYVLGHMHLNQYATGQAQPGISAETVKRLFTKCPSLPEQTLIAGALQTIDAKITAVQVQITQMEAFKKGLLQQMFV
jgi:type I restriction enzyme S subunit